MGAARQIVTQGIVLARTDFGEADRIITVLTREHGKIRVLARGVRRIKSKLAGGIELFSVSQLTFLPGRGDIGTLVSARLDSHCGQIVKDIARTMLAYELLKRTNRATEDAVGGEYFSLLQAALQGLDAGLAPEVVELWFDAQLLRLAGHQPNLQTDGSGSKLTADRVYTFDFDTMAFAPADHGPFAPSHIKFLRLAFGLSQPAPLQQVQAVDTVLPPARQLITSIRKQLLRT